MRNKENLAIGPQENCSHISERDVRLLNFLNRTCNLSYGLFTLNSLSGRAGRLAARLAG